MTQTSFEELVPGQFVAPPTMEVPAAGPVPARRLPRWQGALVAVGGLVLIYAIAFGVLVAGGAILHAVDARKRLDPFAAMHHSWVLAVLLGVSLLWLLPPYPWATRVVKGPEHSVAGEVDGAGR